MKTLSQYLQDIAYAVLEPIGCLYSTPGEKDGYSGYSGISSRNSSNNDWNEWTPVCTIELFQTKDGYVTGTIKTDVPSVKYTLMWTCDHNMQGSWWVKQVAVPEIVL